MMSTEGRTDNRQQGQTLILFSFMVAALLLSVMSVIDVGFFLHARQKAQSTADAAALAGAQELPDDPDAAEAIALDYVARNGLDPDETEIVFSCTSNTQNICLEGDGRYDTIRLTPHVKSPTFFGAVLSFIGVDSCWVEGCTAQASAAGCRGACGPVGNAPVDVVEIIDRSSSMSDADLVNAKDGAKALLEFFDPTLQKAGFGVLGPSSTSSLCSGAYSGGIGTAAGSGGTWLPVEMVNNYQNADGSLNTSSTIVKTINCLNKSSVGTNLGSPVKAAADHLAAEGRPDVTWGIILFTDGAATQAPTTTQTSTTTTTNSTNTGWSNCSANQAVTTNAGDNNGYQSSAGSACSDDNNFAVDTDSGTNTNLTCTNTGKDKHRYYNYGFSFPSGTGITNAVDGIEVELRARADSTTGTPRLCVELSWDGGTSWTSAKTTANLTTSEVAYTLGASSDTWGNSWTTGQLSNSNFRIRVTSVASNASRDFSIDSIRSRVHYTTTTVTTTTTTVWDGSDGPCDYAMKQADYAKSLGIEVYTIGYGVGATDRCVDEDSDSPWDNDLVTDLLEAMATDEGHFFNSPLNADLEPVFVAIGGGLTAGGSRLIE